MSYGSLGDVNATTDVSNLLIYVNNITDGLAMPMVLAGYFIVAFLAGAFAQMRFRGAVRFDFSFAAAAFSTFGLAVIMSLKEGLLGVQYLIITIVIAIISAAWLFFPSE